MPEDLLDPDCRAGKHASCIGGPCACECHRDDPADLAAPTEAPAPIVEDGVEVDPTYYVPPDQRLDHDPDEPTGMAGGDDSDAINAARGTP